MAIPVLKKKKNNKETCTWSTVSANGNSASYASRNISEHHQKQRGKKNRSDNAYTFVRRTTRYLQSVTLVFYFAMSTPKHNLVTFKYYIDSDEFSKTSPSVNVSTKLYSKTHNIATVCFQLPLKQWQTNEMREKNLNHPSTLFTNRFSNAW